ncbi:MAG: AAA family ATPase, partial [Paramuribaculum sp.]|nr:AAA family ATPase [Paramuribaculum sp.]
DTKSRLRQMADSGHLPHALLLEGREGIGKFSLARAFAQYIGCTGRRPGDTDSCGKCPSCLHHQALAHIDTVWVYPVVKLEKMNTAPTSDDFHQEWKEFLQGRTFMDIAAWTEQFEKRNAVPTIYVTESDSLIRKLSFESHESVYKTVLWWLPEKMNQETSNKLLKLSEEPYKDTIFIMTSDRPRDLLTTVYSRLQRISVNPYSDEDIADYLVERRGLPSQEAEEISRLAQGSMNEALAAISVSKRKVVMFEQFKQLMRLAYQRNVIELRKWAAELASTGREQQLDFYNYSIRLLRENFMNNFGEAELVFMNDSEKQFGSRFSRFICERNIEQLAALFDEAREDIAANGNGKIINLDVALKVIVLLIPPKQS